MKAAFDAGEQAANNLRTGTILELVQKFLFLTFHSIISNKSVYKLFSVAATKNNQIYKKHVGMILWSISPTIKYNIQWITCNNI